MPYKENLRKKYNKKTDSDNEEQVSAEDRDTKTADDKKTDKPVFVVVFILAESLLLLCILITSYIISNGRRDKINPEDAGSIIVNKVIYNDVVQDTGADVSLSEIIGQAQKSIVMITDREILLPDGSVYNMPEDETERAGSGVVISRDEKYLYILTNFHLVQYRKESISIVFNGGDQCDGKLCGYDENNDLALVLVELKNIDTLTENIVPAVIAESERIRIGDSVVSVGGAVGYGSFASAGIISAKNTWTSNGAGLSVPIIQTDAIINRINDGGALLDTSGNVVGINTTKPHCEYEDGAGYAVPIEAAMESVENIMSGGAGYHNY